MLRISSPKIADLAKELDGIEIEGIQFKKKGEPKGIQVLFTVDTDDEEMAKTVLKKYLKVNHPVFHIYVEVI